MGKYTPLSLIIIFYISSGFWHSMAYAGAKQNQPKPVPEIVKIQKRGELRVGLHQRDLPPFFYVNKSGELTGYDVEIAKGIGRELGVKVVFDRRALTFDEIALNVAAKKYDLGIANMAPTLRRAQYVNFSKSYYFFTHVIVSNRVKMGDLPSHPQKILERLNKSAYTFALEAGTSFSETLSYRFPKVRVQTFPTLPDALEAISRQEADFTVREKAAVDNYLHHNPEAGMKLRVTKPAGWKQASGIAVHSDDKNLLHWINLYLSAIKETGFLRNLEMKYLQEQSWRKELKK